MCCGAARSATVPRSHTTYTDKRHTHSHRQGGRAHAPAVPAMRAHSLAVRTQTNKHWPSHLGRRAGDGAKLAELRGDALAPLREVVAVERPLGAPLALRRLAKKVGDLQVLLIRLRLNRRVVQPRLEATTRARGGAVAKVARRAYDAHCRRGLAAHVRSQLDDDGVLDEVEVLRVLVHVEAGRFERVRPLPQPVRVVELDDGIEPLM
mmetsp:Transcript_8605/g.22164  ORF Transcript_8605/g.22164 Transcript_8605/m.22164 type:complete len:207 (+) Transcript_8605:66-686(+)